MLGLKKITTEYTKIKDCVDAVVEFFYKFLFKFLIESLSSTSLYLASVFLNSYDLLQLAKGQQISKANYEVLNTLRVLS